MTNIDLQLLTKEERPQRLNFCRACLEIFGDPAPDEAITNHGSGLQLYVHHSELDEAHALLKAERERSAALVEARKIDNDLLNACADALERVIGHVPVRNLDELIVAARANQPLIDGEEK